MDLRVTSLLLVLLALAEATPERYYHHVPKVSKSPYPAKSHGESRVPFLMKNLKGVVVVKIDDGSNGAGGDIEQNTAERAFICLSQLLIISLQTEVHNRFQTQLHNPATFGSKIKSNGGKLNSSTSRFKDNVKC